MAIQEYLEKKLRELDLDRKQTLESLDIVREKIKGADAKRGTQPDTDNYHKWSEILRNLEKDLDRHNVHLTAIDAETEEKRRKLDDYRKKAAEAEAMRAALPEKILAMSIEEVAQLTAEEIAMLQEYELSQAALAEAEAAAMEGEDASALETAAEPAQEGSPSDAGEVEPAEAPAASADKEPAAAAEPAKPHVELTGALKKIAENRVSELTLAELDVVVAAYARIRGEAGEDPQQARMRDVFALTMQRLEDAYGGVRKRWAEVMKPEKDA